MENTIGGRIKALRKEKGWGQELLAEKMSVVQSLIAKVEGGTRKLTVDEAIRLAELFETSTDYILRGIQSEFVNVANDLGLADGSIDNLQQLHALILKEGKFPDGRLDTQDTVNALLSYEGFYVIRAITDLFNVPKDKSVLLSVDVSKGGERTTFPVNAWSAAASWVQETLSQLHDGIRRHNRGGENQ